MIDCPTQHFFPDHLLKTKSLGAKLEVIVAPLPPSTVLVLDGIRNLAVELDNVSFTDQAEPLGPQR